MAISAFNRKKTLFTSKLYLHLGKKLVKSYVQYITLYGAETWTLRKVDQKHAKSFKMCWKRMETSWTDCVRYEEVLHRVKEDRNIIHTVKRRKADWIGHILRSNCQLKHITEGKIIVGIEMTEKQRRRRKHLLDEFKETEQGNTRSHSVENSLCKRLWNCRQADYGMNE